MLNLEKCGSRTGIKKSSQNTKLTGVSLISSNNKLERSSKRPRLASSSTDSDLSGALCRIDANSFSPNKRKLDPATEATVAKKRRLMPGSPKGQKRKCETMSNDCSKRRKLDLKQGTKRKRSETEDETETESAEQGRTEPCEVEIDESSFGEFQYWRQRLPSLEEVEKALGSRSY